MTRKAFRPYDLLLLLCVCLLIATCGSGNNESQSGKVETPEAPADSVTVELTGRDSTTVFELLQSEHAVDFQQFSMGVFIKGIDSVYSNSEYFWVYSVNDSMAKVACDKFVTAGGDNIVWRLRRVGK